MILAIWRSPVAKRSSIFASHMSIANQRRRLSPAQIVPPSTSAGSCKRLGDWQSSTSTEVAFRARLLFLFLSFDYTFVLITLKRAFENAVMDYNSLVQKTVTLRGRLTTAMGGRHAGEEVAVETPSKPIYQSLAGLKDTMKGLMSRKPSCAGEIGWAMQGRISYDETDQFYRIMDDLKKGPFGSSSEKMLAYSYLLVPGLFCNSYPTYFREILAYFKNVLGVQCEFAQINTEGSVKDNAKAVRDIVVKQYVEFGKQVVLLGHSKGGTDAAATCAMFWGELRDKVRGLIMLQAVYGGTPLAADLLSGGQFGALNSLFLGKLTSFSNPEGTVDAIKDMTYKNRHAFIEEYPMPSDVPTLCFHSNFPPDSQTRFKKYVMKENFLSGRLEVPLEIQLGKQLAMMAKYILSNYPGEESDGLVTRRDAEVPGSVVVKFRGDLAHTLVIPEAFPPDHSTDGPEPLNASFVCQACIILLLSTR